MDKRFWLAAVAYLAPTFPLGYMWHLVIFADRYAAMEVYREQLLFPMGLAAMFTQAVLFAWAYPRLFGRLADWKRGALGFGVFFGFLAWSFAVLSVAAKYRMNSVVDFALLETGFTVLQFVVVSPCVALAYRHVHPAPPSGVPGVPA
jgi:hypothetical protein